MSDFQAVKDLLTHYPELSCVIPSLEAACALLEECYRGGGVLYTCGNGGSCADADHITGELLKGFCNKRPMPAEEAQRLAALAPEEAPKLSTQLQVGLRAISLMSFGAGTSAAANDLGYELGPAQMLYAMGKPGDVLLALSTSGNALNVRYAIAVARLKNIKVIGFTGDHGGYLAQHSDIAIKAPAKETYRIQEYHLPVYHALCRMVETAFFGPG